MSTKLEAFPIYGIPEPLIGTRWRMIEFDGTNHIEGTDSTWEFYGERGIRDNPLSWSGEWQKLSDDRIQITQVLKDKTRIYLEAVFVLPHYFIIIRSDTPETGYKVIYCGVRVDTSK